MEDLDPNLRALFFATLLGPAFATHRRIADTDLQSALDTYRKVVQHIRTGEDFVKAPAIPTNAPVRGGFGGLPNIGRLQQQSPTVPMPVNPGQQPVRPHE
jgi:hypothetical protein